jgi:hypothetical protein
MKRLFSLMAAQRLYQSHFIFWQTAKHVKARLGRVPLVHSHGPKYFSEDWKNLIIAASRVVKDSPSSPSLYFLKKRSKTTF